MHRQTYTDDHNTPWGQDVKILKMKNVTDATYVLVLILLTGKCKSLAAPTKDKSVLGSKLKDYI